MSEQEKTSLLPCPDCGNSCSTAALACPSCGKPLQPHTSGQGSTLGDTVYTRIFTQSSTKVGVCLTLLGLIKVVEGLKKVSTPSDEILIVGAIAFLMSELVSFSALKQGSERRKYVLGRVANALFVTALCLLIISLIFLYKMS